MIYKFLNLLSFDKAAPIFSVIIFISVIMGLNTPSTMAKLICGVVSTVSFITIITCAKVHKIN